jgi:hypothetical protein
MKRCSTCNRTYTDPNLSFCTDDGTPLTTVESEGWNAVAYQPPGSYVPPGTELKQKRRVWPWIVGIAGAFILGIFAITIVAAVLVPSLMRSRQHERTISNINQPENSNTAENENSSNSNTTENVETPPPKDHDQVLAQLTDIENEWTVANVNADKNKLERILADDFVGKGPDGEPQSKADYIGRIQRDVYIDKWEFSDLKLVLVGDRATLSGTFTYESRDGTKVFEFVDKFVWRDGRWQATSAELEQKE